MLKSKQFCIKAHSINKAVYILHKIYSDSYQTVLL